MVGAGDLVPAGEGLKGPLRAGCGVALLLAGFLVAPLFGAGAPPGDDALGHAIRARFFVETLLPHGRLDGWQPLLGVGYAQHLFLGPGLSLAVALVQGLSLGALSTLSALKVVTAAAFCAVPVAVAFLARSVALSPRASGLAALLSLCVASRFGGVGIPGTFEIGLLAHQLAAVPTLVALGCLLRTAATPERRWTITAVIALTAVLVTHAISALLLAVLLMLILPLVFARVRPTPAPLLHLAAAWLLGAALAGFWLVPALWHHDLRGISSAFPLEPLRARAVALFAGISFLRGPLTVALALAGIGVCLLGPARRRGRFALALALGPLAYLALAELLARTAPLHVVTLQLTHRGLGYVGVLAILPAAALIDTAADRLGRAGSVAALVAAFALAAHAALPLRSLARSESPTPQLEELAAQIAAQVPDGARFVAQSHPLQRELTGVRRPSLWLAFASRRPLLNSFIVESSTLRGELAFAADHITSMLPDDAADTLGRLGASHVAIVNDAAAPSLLSSPRFRVVWRSPPLALLAIVPPAGRPEPASLVSAEAPAGAHLVTAEPEHLVFDVDASRDTTATLAVGWSPRWRATLDAAPAALWRSREGLVSVRVPAGASRLELAFGPDPAAPAGVALTLAAALALPVLCLSRAARDLP